MNLKAPLKAVKYYLVLFLAISVKQHHIIILLSNEKSDPI